MPAPLQFSQYPVHMTIQGGTAFGCFLTATQGSPRVGQMNNLGLTATRTGVGLWSVDTTSLSSDPFSLLFACSSDLPAYKISGFTTRILNGTELRFSIVDATDTLVDPIVGSTFHFYICPLGRSSRIVPAL